MPCQRSLLEFLDTSQLNCLNEAVQHPLKPILEGKVRNTTDKYLLSDADDQLLLNVHVRLDSGGDVTRLYLGSV